MRDFSLDGLSTPIVAAPMAGGPSTPALVTAVARAGGVGFLAAGYLGAEALAAQIAVVQEASVPFGVNVFVPDDDPVPAEIEAFRDRLRPLAARFGVDLPRPHPDDDAYRAKLDLLHDTRVPVASFTFGCPDPADVRSLQRHGTFVVVTVTSPAAAQRALAAGADALCVQGPEAGGHRSTFTVAEPPDGRPLAVALQEVRAKVSLPLLAAGGIMTADDVAFVRAAGAVAAQCGTAFLLADESGTNTIHRVALADPGFTETSVTRAFSGRWARGLVNAWVAEYADAPAAYPAVNQVTSPLRRAAAAAGDAQHTHLWAGTGWRAAVAAPARTIVARLAG